MLGIGVGGINVGTNEGWPGESVGLIVGIKVGCGDGAGEGLATIKAVGGIDGPGVGITVGILKDGIGEGIAKELKEGIALDPAADGIVEDGIRVVGEIVGANEG